jgi:hypothetical protein
VDEFKVEEYDNNFGQTKLCDLPQQLGEFSHACVFLKALADRHNRRVQLTKKELSICLINKGMMG